MPSGARKGQVWAVYLQSDYKYLGGRPARGGEPDRFEECGETKFRQVWRDVDYVLASAKKLGQTEPLRVEFYSMTSPPRSLAVARFDQILEKADEQRYPIERDNLLGKKIPELIEKVKADGKRNHGQILADTTGTNDIQNVVASVGHIIARMDDWFAGKEELVRIVFISDMLHYSTGQLDLDRSIFHMADRDHRKAFQDFVKNGHLISSRIAFPPKDFNLPDGARFEVWNFDIPRCSVETLGLPMSPNWTEVDSEVKPIWNTVFEMLHAKTHWNVSESSLDIQ